TEREFRRRTAPALLQLEGERIRERIEEEGGRRSVDGEKSLLGVMRVAQSDGRIQPVGDVISRLTEHSVAFGLDRLVNVVGPHAPPRPVRILQIAIEAVRARTIFGYPGFQT